MNIKIESGIPIPSIDKKSGRRKSELSELFKKMELMQSIVLPTEQVTHAINLATRNGFRVITRKIDSKTKRLWKVG